jgi:hypothetical protein
MTMNTVIFWNVILCSMVGQRRFGEAHCLHLQGRIPIQETNQTLRMKVVPSSVIWVKFTRRPELKTQPTMTNIVIPRQPTEVFN